MPTTPESINGAELDGLPPQLEPPDTGDRFAAQHPGFDDFLRALARLAVERRRRHILTQCQFANSDEGNLDPQGRGNG